MLKSLFQPVFGVGSNQAVVKILFTILMDAVLGVRFSKKAHFWEFLGIRFFKGTVLEAARRPKKPI